MYSFYKSLGLFEELRSFTRQPHHKVYPEKDKRLPRGFHCPSYAGNLLLEEGCVIMASHKLQQLVGAGLQRDVEVSLEFGA